MGRIPIILSLGVAILASWGFGGMSAPPESSPDVLVATVIAVSDEGATNGNPPRVRLEVHESLRGDPKADRTRAVWNAPPHDIDTSGREAELARWKATPLKGPRIGQKFILFGWLRSDDGEPLYEVHGHGKIPFTPEARRKAVEAVERVEKQVREYREQQERERREQADRVKNWRAQVDSRAIARYAAQADVVAVGRVSSQMISVAPENPFDFTITRFIRGRPRKEYADGKHYLSVNVPQRLAGLLDRDHEYLLFLSEKGVKNAGATMVYPRIEQGDGIVIADPESIKAAEEAAGRKK